MWIKNGHIKQNELLSLMQNEYMYRCAVHKHNARFDTQPATNVPDITTWCNAMFAIADIDSNNYISLDEFILSFVPTDSLINELTAFHVNFSNPNWPGRLLEEFTKYENSSVLVGLVPLEKHTHYPEFATTAYAGAIPHRVLPNINQRSIDEINEMPYMPHKEGQLNTKRPSITASLPQGPAIRTSNMPILSAVSEHIKRQFMKLGPDDKNTVDRHLCTTLLESLENYGFEQHRFSVENQLKTMTGSDTSRIGFECFYIMMLQKAKQ